MQVSLFTVLANHLAVIVLVLTKELLGFVVRVDVDFCEGVVGGWFNAAFMDARFQPRQQQFQAIALLNFLYKFVGAELSFDDKNEVLDNVFRAVNIGNSAESSRLTRCSLHQP
jgi:hypothetical protein